MEGNLQRRVAGAARWSVAAEVAAKLVSLGVNMLLARLVAPAAYGVLATAMMVTSFADLFTDAGFQKYLIQHEFADDASRADAASVAFWTNLLFSFALWGVICLLRDPIAAFAGSPGYGAVVAVACAQLPFTAFTSIGMALLRRALDFRRLFFLRMAQSAVPLFVTVPLALLGLSHWALVLGTLAGHVVNAAVLLLSAPWRPRLFFRLGVLRDMLSFSFWTMLEAVSIWACSWFDIFLIGNAFSEYYLGLYRNSVNNAGALIALVTTPIYTVLFSGLSRLQEDAGAFARLFYITLQSLAFIVFPMGVGLFLYRGLATDVLLGSQWTEAVPIVGLWALSSAIMSVVSSPCSEVLRARGLPRVSLFCQMIKLVLSVAACLWAIPHGFFAAVCACVVMRFSLPVVLWAAMRLRCGFRIADLFRTLWKPTICTAMMAGLVLLLQRLGGGTLWSWCSIGLCALFYALLLLLFARREVRELTAWLLPGWAKRGTDASPKNADAAHNREGGASD